MKYTLRQESARDHVDGLLSFIQRPNVYISDIASQVAHHGENRLPDMFEPYKGMLYEWSKKNLLLQKEGLLKKVEIDPDANPEKYYSLLDRFHTKSKKKGPERSFRDLRNCMLDVNSSVAEQQNAVMARDR
ncbi:uncharacterized protein LOC144425590 [Styela clava]